MPRDSRELQDWLNSYMIYTRNTEPSDNFRLWTAISTISACLRRKCSLPWGMMTVYPNLYIVLVGPSGCRKGTAMGPAYSILSKMGIRMASEAITREALIRELKNTSDTHYGEHGEIYIHASLTIFSQELTVFLGYNNMQLMADLCDWFDCRESWTYRTKHSGTDDITGIWVNLIGATTPSLLQTTLPQDAIGGGLTARMIMVYAARKGRTVVQPFLTKEEVEIGEKLYRDAERISMLHGEFSYTSRFLDDWTKWYSESDGHPPFDDLRFGGYFERRAIHILKLCMVMSASRSSSMVLDDIDLRRAIKLLTEEETRMKNVFAGVGRSKIIDLTNRVIQLIVERGEIYLDEVLRKYHYDADTYTMDVVIKTLQDMKSITVGYEGGRTLLRPTRRIDDGLKELQQGTVGDGTNIIT